MSFQVAKILLIFFIFIIIIATLHFAYFNEKPIYINKHDVVSRIMRSKSKGEKMARKYNKTMNKMCKKLNKSELNAKYKNVYVINNVFSKNECDWIIYESEQYAKTNGWFKKRHDYYPTVDNNINLIDNINYYLQNKIYKEIIPLFEKHYNLQSNFLGLDEAFIVKYSCKSQSFLEKHCDFDDFSFVVVLNDDFDGGGTYFYDICSSVNPPTGSVVIFCGKNEHMGLEIQTGHRYILAGFLSYGIKQYIANKLKTNFDSYYK